MLKISYCKIFCAALFGLGLIPFSASADFSSSIWQFRKPLSVPVAEAPAYVRVPLDNSVASSNDDYRDVRVVTASGQEVPYQLMVENASREQNFYPSTLADSVIDASGNASFIIDLGSAGNLHNNLSVDISSVGNYKRLVTVYTADSHSGAWEKAGAGYIFSFADRDVNFSAKGNDVSYADSSRRYLKVVIAGGAEGPLAVSNARVYRYLVSQAKENAATYDAIIRPNQTEKSTELVIDRGVIGVPAYRVELSSPNTNFNRRAVIQASNDGQDWQAAGQGYLFNIELPKFSGGNMAIDFGEVTSRYFRVIVFNADDQPLSFAPAVKVFGVARNIVFQAVPNQSYYLYYGNSSANRPSYDLVKLFSYLDLNGIKPASAEAGEMNPNYIASKTPEKTFTEKYPQALNIILVLVVAAIAVFLFLYIRAYYKKPEDTEGEIGDDNFDHNIPKT